MKFIIFSFLCFIIFKVNFSDNITCKRGCVTNSIEGIRNYFGYCNENVTFTKRCQTDRLYGCYRRISTYETAEGVRYTNKFMDCVQPDDKGVEWSITNPTSKVIVNVNITKCFTDNCNG